MVWQWEKIDKFVPRVTEHRKKLPLWITSPTSHLIKKLETIKKKPNQDLKRLLKIKKILEASEEDLSQFETKVLKTRTFSQIQKYLKCVRKTPTIPPTVRNGSNVSTNGKEKCELFNYYFVGLFSKSEMKLDSTSEPGTLNQLKMNQNQISDNMEHLNVNKSMGHDKIGNLVLKKCHSTLSKSLTLIFQTCLNKGSFPETWKLSQVTPIFKEGNKADVSCYRPISLLCCCSKILEKSYLTVYTSITKIDYTKVNLAPANEDQRQSNC